MTPLLFCLFASTFAGIVVMNDQYFGFLKFLNDSQSRFVAIDPSNCPTDISPPNGRVACNARGQIIKIHLAKSSLSGTLSPSILTMPELIYVNISDNNLVGETQILSSLKNLETLDLSYNALTGDALTTIESLGNLKKCVLQALAPRDTNCFTGSLESTAIICNDDHLSPLNLCKTPISRPTTIPKQTTTTTTTTTTTKPSTTTVLATPSPTEAKTTKSVLVLPSETPDVIATAVLGEKASTTTTTTTTETTTTKKKDGADNIETGETAEMIAPATDSHLVVIIVVSILALAYLVVVGLLVAFKIRKQREQAESTKMFMPSVTITGLASVPPPLLGQIIDVEDIDSEPDPSLSRANSAPNNRSSLEYTKLPSQQLGTGYAPLPAAAGASQGENKRSLRQRKDSLKRPAPFDLTHQTAAAAKQNYDRFPARNASSVSLGNGKDYVPVAEPDAPLYDRVMVTPTVYDAPESSLD